MRRRPSGLLLSISVVVMAPGAVTAEDAIVAHPGSGVAEKAADVPGAVQGETHQPKKRPGRTKFGDITLKKGYTAPPAPKAPVGSFRGMEAPDSETEVVEFEEGEDRKVRKRPPRAGRGDVTLKRGTVDVPAPEPPPDR